MTTLILNALIPVALLIALGNILRRIDFPGAAFWPLAERLAYFVLLPTLFAYSLYSADLSGMPIGAMAAGLIFPAVIGTLVLMLANKGLNFDGSVFTSVVQGGIRFNNYVGVTAAVGLLGITGAALAAVTNAILVPTVNILCALIFARYAGRDPRLGGIVRAIALNPLILGCLAGILLRLTGVSLPSAVEGFASALGQAALPIGLLCVGAALDFRALGSGVYPATIAVLAKFLLVPIITAIVCVGIGLTGPAALVVILIQCLPTASSSYIMARQLGGDAPLMAGIIALQTLIGVITVPLTLLLLAPLVDGTISGI